MSQGANPFCTTFVIILRYKVTLVVPVNKQLFLGNSVATDVFLLFTCVKSLCLSRLLPLRRLSVRLTRSLGNIEGTGRVLSLPVFSDIKSFPGSRSIALGTIHFSCSKGASILASYSLRITRKRGMTVMNTSKTKGAAIVRLVSHFCSIASNRILVNNRGVGSVTCRGLLGGVSVMFRGAFLAHSDMLRGVHVNDGTALRRIQTTTGRTRVSSFVVSLPSKCSAGINDFNSHFSNKRGREVTVTHTVLGGTPVLVLSRTADTTSPRGRMRVSVTVSGLYGKGAILVMTRHLNTVGVYSGITIIRGRAVATFKARRRILRRGRCCRET